MGEKKVGKIQNQSFKSKTHFGKDFGLTVAPSDWSSTIQLLNHSIFHSNIWTVKKHSKTKCSSAQRKNEQQFSHFWHMLTCYYLKSRLLGNTFAAAASRYKPTNHLTDIDRYNTKVFKGVLWTDLNRGLTVSTLYSSLTEHILWFAINFDKNRAAENHVVWMTFENSHLCWWWRQYL